MAKGQTYYVDHVSANLPWTTKETPDNVRTKGAIKFKDCNLQILEDNTAIIKVLTEVDKLRIKHQSRGLVRIFTRTLDKIMETMKFQDMWFGPSKRIGLGCGSSGYLLDIKEKEMLVLTLTHKDDFNVIQPNHPYFKLYDDNVAREQSLEDLYDTED